MSDTRTPDVLLAPRDLNSKGQCCGRKPIVYKKEPHLFCDRCSRAFDPTSKKQIANWAYLDAGNGQFKVRHIHMLERARR